MNVLSLKTDEDDLGVEEDAYVPPGSGESVCSVSQRGTSVCVNVSVHGILCGVCVCVCVCVWVLCVCMYLKL